MIFNLPYWKTFFKFFGELFNFINNYKLLRNFFLDGTNCEKTWIGIYRIH